MLADGRRELLAYPTAAHRFGRVTRARRRDDGLFALTVAGSEPPYAVRAHRVVLATGVVDACPDVIGFAEHYGASAFHCPACDGYEAKDCDVVALGWEARLVAFAATLLGWARSVTVVTDGRRFEGDDSCRALLARESMELVEDEAVELIGPRGALRALRLRGGRELACSLLFFSVAHLPRTDLATELGCAVD